MLPADIEHSRIKRRQVKSPAILGGIKHYPYLHLIFNERTNEIFLSIKHMKSLKELYRIGTGPSSSHTMGPRKAAEQFLARHPEAASFQVTLYGSLAATGKAKPRSSVK